MVLIRNLFFSFFFACIINSANAQDTLVVQGNISTTTATSVGNVNIEITYFDSSAVLKLDTFLTDTLGFYSDTLVNSNVDSIVVRMKKCTNISTYYPKGVGITSWTGLKTEVIDFTNFCFSANFNFYIDGRNDSVNFTSTVVGGVSPFNYDWDFGDSDSSIDG